MSNIALVGPHCGKPTRVGYRSRTGEGARLPPQRERLDIDETGLAGPRAPGRACKARYESEIRPRAPGGVRLPSPMQDPRLEKITLNMGVGEAKTNTKALDEAVEQLAMIAGQRPLITRAEVDRPVQAPRGHGHRLQGDAARRPHVGVPRPADVGRAAAHPRLPRHQPRRLRRAGQLRLGLREQTIFPEIDYDRIDTVRGLNVTITTTATDRRGGPGAPATLGMPFRERRDEMAKTSLRVKASRTPKYTTREYTPLQ